MLKLDELFKLVEELDLSVKSLPEQENIEAEQEAVTIKLPKFRISERWGTPGTDDRKIIEMFTSKIVGSTLEEKLLSLQSFIKDCDDRCVEEKDISQIMANLVFLDCLASLIYDFNDKTGGFLFESLLSALLGGKSRQIPTPGGPNQPIEDLLDSDGESPLSLKFLFKGPKYIKGSGHNLVRGILKYDKPIKYIIALKEREGKDVMRIKFLTFNMGLGAGSPVQPYYKQFMAKEEGVEIEYDNVPEHLQGDHNVDISWLGSSGQFGLYLNRIKAKHIGTLDLGSREQIQAIGQKYVARLGERLTSIYQQLELLSNNVNRYFLNSPEEKGSALAAQNNAKELKQKTEQLD